VHEHTHVTFVATHDLSDVAHAEVGNHPQQHSFRLIVWQLLHECNRSIEGGRTVSDIGGVWRQQLLGRSIVGRSLPGIDVAALLGPNRVDSSSSGDGEQPTTKVFLIALEA